MIMYHISPTAPAQICKLEYDSTTGEGRVMLSDTLELPKHNRITCTTLEEFTILKQLGYNVGLNPDPSDATINGVKVEGVPAIGNPAT